MKKKGILILIMIICCVALIFFVGRMQNKYVYQGTQENSAKSSETVLNKSEGSNNIKQEEKNDTPVNTEVKEKSEPKNTAVQSTESEKKLEVQKDTQATQSTQTKENSKSSTKEGTDTKQSTQGVNTAPVKAPEKAELPNFYIKDTTNGHLILSCAFEVAGKTVGEVTTTVLDQKGISYRAKGSGGSIYFSAINGIKERDKGPASGWCYYVNGGKVAVSAGSYKLKAGDMVEWRYLQDGLNK